MPTRLKTGKSGIEWPYAEGVREESRECLQSWEHPRFPGFTSLPRNVGREHGGKLPGIDTGTGAWLAFYLANQANAYLAAEEHTAESHHARSRELNAELIAKLRRARHENPIPG